MQSNAEFLETIWSYYAKHGRDLPWRQPENDGTFNGYKILVSEIMLQQTQVTRVVEKYQQFLVRFPDVQTLANAALVDVLAIWSGLGYNRRAQFLHQAAQKISADYAGSIPKNLEDLISLPGVGHNTAAAILAYTYNVPTTFVETNIRTVYIYHFFADQTGVDDKQILAKVAETLDKEHPREFYWALMDYGTFLKTSQGNASRQSKHYSKQSKFEGSRRQIRGLIIKQLVSGPRTLITLQKHIPDDRLMNVLTALCSEGIVEQEDNKYAIKRS